LQTWLFREGDKLVAVLMSSQADAKLTAADLAKLEAEFLAATPAGYQKTRAEFARWLRNARNWRGLYHLEYP
jgi:hypothetical protein